MVDNARYRKLNNIFLVKCTQQPDLQNKKSFMSHGRLVVLIRTLFSFMFCCCLLYFLFSLSLCVCWLLNYYVLGELRVFSLCLLLLLLLLFVYVTYVFN